MCIRDRPIGSPGGSTYTKINIQISFAGGSAVDINSGSGNLTVSGNPLILYYRTEQNGSISPNSATSSSLWVNGNSTVGIQIGPGNYFNTTSLTQPVYGRNGLTLSGTTATFTLFMPIGSFLSSTQPTTLYVRIGSQNNSNFKITNVQAQLF